MDTDGAVTFETVTRRFNGTVAVSDMSLHVEAGTIVGIIGPSGAGKTTAVRLMTGGLEPSSGRVRVLGEDPRSFRRRTRERIGYMPQQFTLYPDLTAGENVDFVASLFGLLWLRRRRRVRDVLRLVDLWDVRGRRAGALSGGMQRRLELASALVHDPALLFLDEPTAGVDPLLRARIWEELHRIRDAGRTLVVTTQYVTEAEECDRVALVADGRLVAFAAPDDLRRTAVGGEVIEVRTNVPLDAARIAGLDGVREIRQTDPRTFLATVDDAGAATPELVDAVGREGADTVSVREYRPSFDEVFATLVARSAQPEDGTSVDPDAPARAA
jgi:ABC-2 type transport system ATP-binding protein